MNKRGKDIILYTLALVFVIFVSVFVFYMGGKVNPFIVLGFTELLVNFWLIPRLVHSYYKLYRAELPNKISFLIPFYNSTMVMNKFIANLSMVSLLVVFASFIVAKNIGWFSFLDFRGALIFMDIVPKIMLASIAMFFIVTGIGLATVSLKIKELHKLFFGENKTSGNKFAAILSAIISSSSIIETLFYVLPFVRILPLLMILDKTSELLTFDVSFEDYEDGEQEESDE